LNPQPKVRIEGTITEWKERQGFGFIAPDAGGDRVFVHHSAFETTKRRPVAGAKVIYELAPHKNRRVCASKVVFAMDTAAGRVADLESRPRQSMGAWFVALFLSLLAAITFKGYLPIAILGLYVVLSVLSFAAYAMDKSAARKGEWRTSEITLHLFDLIGGWPGGLLAQTRLRHKSSKASFKATFWLTVVANCAGLAWLLSESGKIFLLRFF
jgi:uncharacterized membrane protein YsdA (DUF1294 family)/cold shock CspA family protein